jgi:SOUL heme-binding protein
MKVKIKVMHILGIGVLAALMLSVVVGKAGARGVERRKYELVKEEDGFEIRYYPKAIAASVVTEPGSYMDNSSHSFRQLAGYIFGGNKMQKKVAMTAPVAIVREDNKNTMSFYMPSQYSIDELPEPSDSSVHLSIAKDGYFAAIKFGGFANNNRIEAKKQTLAQMLQDKHYNVIGKYTYLGYNAPWDIIGRENEIIVEVRYGE